MKTTKMEQDILDSFVEHYHMHTCHLYTGITGKSLSGVIGSLVKKGLITVGMNDGLETATLTEAGEKLSKHNWKEDMDEEAAMWARIEAAS